MAIAVLSGSTALAQSVEDTLWLTFDDPAAPFRDDSPYDHPIDDFVIADDPGFPGAGVQWSDVDPSPAGGGYAEFDGGSYLQVPTSPLFEYPADVDFTIRFWFCSEGIDRGEDYGKYRSRQHALGFGRNTAPFGTGSNNLDVDFDDPDWPTPALWVYWSGEGSNSLYTSQRPGFLTDGAWYQLFLDRHAGQIRLVVRDTTGATVVALGPVSAAGRFGSATGSNFIGRGAWVSGHEMLWFGAIDEVRITRGLAIDPDDEPVDPPVTVAATLVAPTCADPFGAALEVDVTSNRPVDRVWYSVNGGPAVDLCVGCGRDPVFAFDVPVDALDTCANTIAVHAASGGEVASATATVTWDDPSDGAICPIDTCNAEDVDGDGTPDVDDLCPDDPFKVEPGQCGCDVVDADADGDLVCDADDRCRGDDLAGDTDGDGWCDDRDNCPLRSNADQADGDADGVGDACEPPPPCDDRSSDDDSRSDDRSSDDDSRSDDRSSDHDSRSDDRSDDRSSDHDSRGKGKDKGKGGATGKGGKAR